MWQLINYTSFTKQVIMVLSLVSCIEIICNFGKLELCLELEWFIDNIKCIKGYKR